MESLFPEVPNNKISTNEVPEITKHQEGFSLLPISVNLLAFKIFLLRTEIFKHKLPQTKYFKARAGKFEKL